jgi:hypothetical protein
MGDPADLNKWINARKLPIDALPIFHPKSAKYPYVGFVPEYVTDL